MSTVRLDIGGRAYDLAVRDGQEEHFRTLALAVDARCRDAARATGGLTEVRQLLFAGLLLADEAAEARATVAAAELRLDGAAAELAVERAAYAALREEHQTLVAHQSALRTSYDALHADHEALRAASDAAPATEPDPATATAIERLAERVEALADGLEMAGTTH